VEGRAARAAAWARSMGYGVALTPALRIALATSPRRSWLRASSSTCAPLAPKRRAVAAPIPLDAPVTRTRLEAIALSIAFRGSDVGPVQGLAIFFPVSK